MPASNSSPIRLPTIDPAAPPLASTLKARPVLGSDTTILNSTISVCSVYLSTKPKGLVSHLRLPADSPTHEKYPFYYTGTLLNPRVPCRPYKLICPRRDRLSGASS